MGWFTCLDGVFARKATASETLPLYSELYPAEQTQEAALPHAVYRFQRFLTWRLATDYGVASSIRKADRLCNPERTHFASLCQSYCTLLAAKFATEEQALQAKQQLMQDVFEPARLLGVPADGVEFFLLNTRNWLKTYGDDKPMSKKAAKVSAASIIARCVLDYNITIVAGATNPSVACKILTGCLRFHKRHFACLLNPKIIVGSTCDQDHRQPSFVTETPGYWPNVIHAIGQARRPSATYMHPNLSADLRVHWRSFQDWQVYHLKPEFVTVSTDERDCRWTNRLPLQVSLTRFLLYNPDGEPTDSIYGEPGDEASPCSLSRAERWDVQRKISARTCRVMERTKHAASENKP